LCESSFRARHIKDNWSPDGGLFYTPGHRSGWEQVKPDGDA